MANQPVRQRGQFAPGARRSKRALKQAWGDAWRSVVMMLYDKLPLVVAVVLVFGVDALRRTLSGRFEGTVAHMVQPALWVAELSLMASLVLPKAILVGDEIIMGIGQLVESVFVVGHRAWYALRTGKRLTQGPIP
jgi:hypothetical protein